ncbi:uncharacterized protein A1O5_00415 [Cladophialophora psammophila CBS 110553]|uniref:EthD domain-containing protein n=1 Tax=Cladophialophora psammophila CBS 110553 TaxID=1182543 RepID=W9X619_9EURO|nr:uncharacterized protein A1O5_00415 [Cladophialophora psammophila CBS 110553]EXJ75907.1 hypothetical protein A1O5_00415 [Cladophialophora psammophila CBS 110553]
MPYIAMVAYPDIPGTNFNEKYYVENHLPMVFQHWAQYGLLHWQVVSFDKSSDGSRTYIAAASMTWDSAESFNKATTSDSMTMMVDDLKNFSNIQPIFLNGTVIGFG